MAHMISEIDDDEPQSIIIRLSGKQVTCEVKHMCTIDAVVLLLLSAESLANESEKDDVTSDIHEILSNIGGAK